MEHLTGSVEASISERNWYAALGLALALPDIAGWLEDPVAGSKERYVRWCGEYLTWISGQEVDLTFGVPCGQRGGKVNRSRRLSHQGMGVSRSG